MDALRTQRIGGNRRAERRVDPSRKPHDGARKAILVHIIAKAKDTGGVIGFIALFDCAMRSFDTNEALGPALPNRPGDHRREGGQLKGERAIGIEAKRCPIEDKLILPAQLIEIEERQFAFNDPRNGNRKPLIRLAAMVGRTIRNKKNLAARLGNTFDRVRAPDILADGKTEAHAFEGHRPWHGAWREHALFVKDSVIWQIGLETDGFDSPFVEQSIGVVAMPILRPRQSNENRRAAVSC